MSALDNAPAVDRFLSKAPGIIPTGPVDVPPSVFVFFGCAAFLVLLSQVAVAIIIRRERSAGADSRSEIDQPMR